MYAYVQHPSYTGLAVMAVGSFFVFFRLDGAIACFVSLDYWPRLQARSAALYAGIGTWLILKELFGTEWERWHAKTKRFIPGVF
jgi:protein-S-isoprenylcysteine O-methyltransferase Ste14